MKSIGEARPASPPRHRWRAAFAAAAATVDTTAWYVLVNRNSGKALDLYASATNDGARISQWTRNNGCTAQSPREPAAGSRTHITTTYSGCRAGYPVQWAAYDNGHLPGPVDGTYAESGVTTWTKGEIWRFFAQFS